MADVSRLVKSMQLIAQPKDADLADIVVGIVDSINPLVVYVDKLKLTSTFLILSPFCKEMKVDMNGTEVVIWEDLAVNDTVYMLKCSRGQKYYLLQRKETE